MAQEHIQTRISELGKLWLSGASRGTTDGSNHNSPTGRSSLTTVTPDGAPTSLITLGQEFKSFMGSMTTSSTQSIIDAGTKITEINLLDDATNILLAQRTKLEKLSQLILKSPEQNNGTLSDPRVQPEVLRLLVMGEVGTGKSSLVGCLYNQTSYKDKRRIWSMFFPNIPIPPSPKSRNSRRSVTKIPQIYPVRIGTKDVLLVDTPGLGGIDDDPYIVLSGIELVTKTVGNFHGILYTTRINSRAHIGHKLLIETMSTLFGKISNNFSNSVIAIGTCKDQAKQTARKRNEWKPENKKEEILREFVGRIHRIAFVTSVIDEDYGIYPDITELVEEVEDLDQSFQLRYVSPSDEEMAQILRNSGWNINATQEKYREARNRRTEFASGFVYGTFGAVTSFLESGYLTRQSLLAGYGYVTAGAGEVTLGTAIGGAALVGIIGVGGYLIIREAFEQKCLTKKLAITRVFPYYNTEVLSFSALLSSLVYHVKTTEEFGIALRHHLGEDRFNSTIKCYMRRPTPDSQNYDKLTHLPVLSVVVERKLYISWQGTSTINDILSGLHTNVSAAQAWHDVFPNINVHSGMKSIVDNQLARGFVDRLRDLVEKYNIEEVFYTGHSLGGGVAQIALMTTIGLLRGQNCNQYESLSHINFSVKAFAAPMVFNFSYDELLQEEKNAIHEFQANAEIYIYGQDPVPRMPGHTKFWKPAVSQIISEGNLDEQNEIFMSRESYLGLPLLSAPQPNSFVIPSFLQKQGVSLMYNKLLQNMEKDQNFQSSCSRFKHIAKLIYIKPCQGGNFEFAIVSNDRFFEENFNKDEDKFLIESHLVLPHCFGSFQSERLGNILEKLGYEQN